MLIDGDMDGVLFDSNSIVTEDITKDTNYKGTRVRVAGRMENVRLNVQIDFGVGDAVFPSARIIEYPTLLNQPALKLRAYPNEAVIAENFQTMVELDLVYSRVIDFYDIGVYSRDMDFDGATLAKSFAATFANFNGIYPLRGWIWFSSRRVTASAPIQTGRTSMVRCERERNRASFAR